MSAKILLLDGLNDAKLCQLLESLLATIPGVDKASINFMSQRLTLQLDDGYDPQGIIASVSDTLKAHVPDISVRNAEMNDAFSPPPVVNFPAFEYVDYRFERPEEAPPADGDGETEDAGEARPRPPALSLAPDTSVRLLGLAITAGLLLLAVLPPFRRFESFLLILSSFSGMAFTLFPPPDRWFLRSGLAMGAAVLAGMALLLTGALREASLSLLCYQACLLLLLLLYDRFDEGIARLIDICPPNVERQRDGLSERVAVEQVLLGDRIMVGAGDTIPFDGIVLEGTSVIRPSVLSGGTEPFPVSSDDRVSCGDVNLDAPLIISVSCLQELSPAFQVRKMLTDRRGADSPSCLRARGWETSLLIAALLPLAGTALRVWLGATLLSQLPLLLTSVLLLCPGGVAISVRAAQLGGLGRALRRGVFIHDAKRLDALGNLKSVVLGCGGILTTDDYVVREVRPLPDGVSPEELLRLASMAESRSDHPIARAIRAEYKKKTGMEPADNGVATSEIIAGYGARIMYQHGVVLVGNEALMNDAGVELPPRETSRPCVFVSQRGQYLGMIAFDVPVREEAEGLAARLKALGPRRVGILSAADPLLLQLVGQRVGTGELYLAATPSIKQKTLQALTAQESHADELLFVGDHSNLDFLTEPFLKAMMGTEQLELGLYAADLVIPSYDLDELVEAVRIARRIRRLVLLDLTLCLLARVALCAAVFFGFAPVWTGFLGSGLLSALVSYSAARTLH